MKTTEPLGVKDYIIVQDTELYRFTTDAVLLSRFLTAKRGERVADFCAGCGIVGLHFFAENRGIEEVRLFEMQSALADLCRETAARNHLTDKFFVEEMRVQDAPARFNEYFSLILANPPFERGGFAGASKDVAPCKKELTLTLGELIHSAKRCLKYGGRFALVHRADRAAEVIALLHEAGLEPKKMQFVAGKAGRKPYAVLLSAVKGGRTGVEVLPETYNQREEI